MASMYPILNLTIQFTIREVLGIMKKEFHEVIIDAIWRKREVVEEMSGVNTVAIWEEGEDIEIALLVRV